MVGRRRIPFGRISSADPAIVEGRKIERFDERALSGIESVLPSEKRINPAGTYRSPAKTPGFIALARIRVQKWRRQAARRLQPFHPKFTLCRA
jgi:hypothetical protein